MKTISHTCCLSVKNKRSSEQCSHKKKEGKLFCGIHLRTKNVKRVDEMGDIYNILEYKERLADLYEERLFSKVDLTKSVKNIKIRIKKKKNKYKDLVIKKLIKIQSVLRCYDIKRRNKSTNKVSCITLDNIYIIPSIYVYLYKDNEINKYYCFDIRNLKKIINLNNIINPYTNKGINEEEIKEIKDKLNYLKKKLYTIKLKKDKLTKRQELRSYVLDTFHKIDLLGNYTDMAWFMNLDIYKLYKLYYTTNNIFNRRLPLSLREKKKYVKNGRAFKLKYIDLVKITDVNKLRILILDEYNKFLDHDCSNSDKKTSCIWLLMGLIEVSRPARDALSHLYIFN